MAAAVTEIVSGTVFITCNRSVFYPDRIRGYCCVLPWGHLQVCDDQVTTHRPVSARRDPNPPVWPAGGVRLWAIGIYEGKWPTSAHLIVCSESDQRTGPGAQFTACGLRVSGWLSWRLWQTDGDRLPLDEASVHCGRS